MGRKTSFEKIRDGLRRAIEHEESSRVLTTHDVILAPRPKPMTPGQIAALRTKKIKVSQRVFARLTNTAVQTVQAWEQGRTRPSGCALRFLRMLDDKPEIAEELFQRA